MDKKSKKPNVINIVFIVLVAIILVGSSTLVYINFIKEKEKIIEEIVEERVIDDRISPLENQGVVIEVLRLRHRGLYDKLTTTFGRDWKNKPTFYFVTNMDGLEFASNVVGQHGKFEEINFHTWDTMFMERKIVKDSEEEQETSTITLTIFEKVTTGIISKETRDVERDSITIEYDYRTGRWSGDDSFGDDDGYGHHLGDTFEIWFNVYQMDSDNDFIPYWTEVNVLGTDPMRDDSDKDPDGDGCPTAWEWKWGYDPFTWDDHEKLDPDVDGIENIEEYQMEKWLANPYHQEVYVEVDSVAGTGRFDPPTTFYEESRQAITEKYAEHHISIFFDCGWPNSPLHGGGEHLPYYKKLSQDSGMILEYYNNYFPQERRGIFRYLVLGHAGGYNHPAINNFYDCAYIVHNPLLPYKPFFKKIKIFMNYGNKGTNRGNRVQLAAIVMHEVGHSIGIGVSPFEGVDNNSYALPRFPGKNYKYVDYRSVMNYQCIYEDSVLDYSDGSNGPPYDQNDWEKLFVATFQYNNPLIEEPYFKPPGHDKYVWDGFDPMATGYVVDEDLTQDVIEMMEDYSPVDPITVEWVVFKLNEKDEYPDYKDIKILVKPGSPEGRWVHYADGDLDSEGKIKFYSQQDIIDEIMEQL